MKSRIILIFVFFGLNFGVQKLYGQDIDVFTKHKNDNFNMPEIDRNMTFEEFQFLSRDLRMKHMLYAMVVPGYVHFYIHDNITAYSILGTRLAGYGGLTYVWLKNQNELSLKDIATFNFNKDSFNENDSKKYTAISTVSIAFIFGSYMFDWIRGQQILQKKQEKIRFKYSLKLQSVNSLNSSEIIPIANMCFLF